MTDIAVRPMAGQGPRLPDAMVLSFGPDRVDGLAGLMATLGLPDAAAELVMSRLNAGVRITLHGPQGREVRLVAGGRP